MMDSLGQMEEMMKDPEKMKQLQEEVDKVMADPAKKKAIEEYQQKMQEAVAKLKDDPDMKDFFADIEKNGMEAFKKYENNDKVLAKFSQATGGPFGMLGAMGGAPPAPADSTGAPLQPGKEVFITGLEKAPQLNGKKAVVVPPNEKERKELGGTNRVIVRLVETGEQFAVKPENLRTASEQADEVLSGSLDDVSVFDPALQEQSAKLRESGKIDALANDPELKPIFEDVKKNGMKALEKYWDDEKLMAKISKAMGTR